MKTITITFPQKTAQQLVKACENTVGAGKLLDNTNWYEKEDFYTKEKPRKGSITIDLELSHKGKSWNECKEIASKEKKEMLNFPEVVYLLQESAEFREMLTGWNWTWIKSRSSDGLLVNVGDFSSLGAFVGYVHPRGSNSHLRVCFSRSAEVYAF